MMRTLVWLLNLVVLLAVLSFATVVVTVLTVAAILFLAVAFILHTLGWDRRVIAYLMRHQTAQNRGRIVLVLNEKFGEPGAEGSSPHGPRPWSQTVDHDEPIDATWTTLDATSETADDEAPDPRLHNRPH